MTTLQTLVTSPALVSSDLKSFHAQASAAVRTFEQALRRRIADLREP
jgi:hypothetical protein